MLAGGCSCTGKLEYSLGNRLWVWFAIPVHRLPADIIQPEKGILLDEVQIFDLGDEGFQYVINYEYDGLSDQDIIDYMQ